MGFCYQKNLSNPTMPVDEAQFWALVRAKQWNENIDKYRETHDASLKRKLPAFIFQSTFDETASKSGKMGAWRKQAATRLTGLVVMDIDHVENPQEIYDSWVKVHDLKELGILLIYITPSGHGLKIVFKADAAKGNLIDNQHAMAKVLGVVVDESCKDASRMSFICKESDILYIDNELFTYENKEFAEKFTEQYREGHSQATDTQETVPQCSTSGAQRGQSPSAMTYHGVPYSKIVEAWLGGEEPGQGDRHRTSLILADHLRYITDNDPQLIEQILRETPFVKEIIDERNEDISATVKSAQGYEFLKGIPKRMQAALEAAGASTNQATLPAREGLGEVSRVISIDQRLWEWGKEIEALSEDFPILKDICKGLKRNQYPAALFVAGGLMMTLMTRCTYRFYHRPEELRRLNSSTLIIGDPASGKSFATRLYRILSAPIIEADKVGKDAINAYRDQIRTKGANKEKPQKPKVVIRVHPARTSNAQFIQDMVNAVEEVDGEKMQLHMLTFDTELDNTICVQKGGSWIDKQSLELKAFHNEEDGQAYSNNDSILQDFYVTWNYIYTGTPLALKKKINEHNFGSGLATRLTCIPLPPTNFQMLSREVTLDYDADKRLKEWAYKLDKMKGLLSLDKIVDELFGWTERRMADAYENESKAEEMLLKRCAYHGLNFSAPFIVMRHWDKIHQDGNYFCGEFETDDVDWRLAELIVNIQYVCQRHFFGALAEHYFDNLEKEASVNVNRRQKTYEAFNRLPEEFTVADVIRCFNLGSEGSARIKVSRLLKDNLVTKAGDSRRNHETTIYKKTGNTMQ